MALPRIMAMSEDDFSAYDDDVVPNSSGKFPPAAKNRIGHFIDIAREEYEDGIEMRSSRLIPSAYGNDAVGKRTSAASGASAPVRFPVGTMCSSTSSITVPAERVRVIYFDFDCTLACVHVWKCLAGYPDNGPNAQRAMVPSPHFYSERGQLMRVFQLGRDWCESVMGGPIRVEALRRVLHRMKCERGFSLCVMSKGCVGTIRKILTEVKLLHLFERTFGADYGDEDGDEVKLPEGAEELLAKPEDFLIEHNDAKLMTMIKDIEEVRGHSISQAILIDDDIEEIKAVRRKMDAIHVKDRAGMGFLEIFKLIQLLGLNAYPYMMRDEAFDIPPAATHVKLGVKKNKTGREKLGGQPQREHTRARECCIGPDHFDFDVDSLFSERNHRPHNCTLSELMGVAEEQHLLCKCTQKYAITAISARGQYGTAFMVRERKSAVLRYVKRVPKSREESLIRLKKAAKHPNVVPLLDLFVTDEHVWAVTGAHPMDLPGGLGRLAEDYGEISTHWIARVFRHAAEGLKFLHETIEAGHGGFRPENIMFDRVPEASHVPAVRIADFSATLRSPHAALSKRLSAFIAPEISAARQGQDTAHTLPADIWAFGVSLQVALFGYSRAPKSKLSRMRWRASFLPCTRQEKDFHAVLQTILVLAPDNRPTVNDLLNFDFFKEQKNLKEKPPPNFLPDMVVSLHLARERARGLHRPLIAAVEQRAREQCEETKELFATADEDGDNSITQKEFRSYWNLVVYPQGVRKAHVSEVLCLLDSDDDGLITFDEWAGFFFSLTFASGDALTTSLKAAFESLPGVIERGGLTCQGLQRLFKTEPALAVKALFDEMDAENTGMVTLKTFSDFVIEVSGALL